MNDMNDTIWVAIISVLGGSIGIKLLERMFAVSDRSNDDSAVLRRELREDMKTLKLEVRDLRDELEVWTKKYYDLYETYAVLKVENEELRGRIVELESEVRHLNVK